MAAELGTVRAAFERRDRSAVRDLLAPFDGDDLARLLLELPKTDRILLFRAMPRGKAADAFANLERDDKDALLRDLTDEEARQLLASLSPDDRTHLLAELPGEVVQRALTLLGPEDLAEARFLLGYPEDSVGPDDARLRPSAGIGR